MGEPYSGKMKDRNGKELEAGHICKVHPTTSLKDRWNRYSHTGNFYASQVKHPYYVEIIEKVVAENYGELTTDLWTNIPGKHGAFINSYLLSKLEIVGTKDTHGHLLFNQFDDQKLEI